MAKEVVNVLYCGMADDIMLPLLLESNLDNLYVIDLFDECFSWNGTLKSQQDDIVNILKNGDDSKSHSRYIYTNETRHSCFKPGIELNCSDIHYLEEKSEILEDERYTNKWFLKFKYLDKIRTMTIYYQNFLEETWPDEINNVKYIITVGSWSFDTHIEEPSEIWINMLKTRTNDKFMFVALSFNHVFENHYIIKHGKSRFGDEIAYIEIAKNDDIDKLIRNHDADQNAVCTVVDFETGKKYTVDHVSFYTIIDDSDDDNFGNNITPIIHHNYHIK